MDCGDACRFYIALNASSEEWSEYRIPLNCFAEGGVDMTRIQAPFIVSMEGEGVLDVSSIRLVDADEAECN